MDTDKDSTTKEKEILRKVKIEVSNKQQTNKTLAKLQSDLDKAQKEYIHAKEAHRRNQGTLLEKQFSIKLKSATTQLDSAKKQLNQISNHVKKEKERKDMYTF
jgi:ribosomal protein S20